MFHPARATAAAAYLGSLIFALFAAFFGGRLRYPLVLISLVVEVLACTFFVLLGWFAFCSQCAFPFAFLALFVPPFDEVPRTAARSHYLLLRLCFSFSTSCFYAVGCLADLWLFFPVGPLCLD